MQRLIKLADQHRETYADKQINEIKAMYGYDTHPAPDDCDKHNRELYNFCGHCQPESICTACGRTIFYDSCPHCIQEYLLQERQSKTLKRIPRAIRNPMLEKPFRGNQETIFGQVIGWLAGVLSGNISNLVFVGTAGCGKTHLSFAVIRYLNENFVWYKGHYENMSNLMPEIVAAKTAFKPDQPIYQRLYDPFVLVLDEIGLNKNQEKERESLYRIIDRRWSDQRPMIFISNLSNENFDQMLGERLCSRVQANGTMYIEFDNLRDYRNYQDTD